MRTLTLRKSKLDRDLRLDVGFNLRMQHAAQVLSATPLPFGQLKDVADLISDGLRTRVFAGEGTPLLRVTNVLAHDLDLGELVYVAPDDVHARHRVRKGDVLLTKTAGDFRAASVLSEADGIAFSSDLVRIRPRSGYSTTFLAYFLNSRHGRRALEAHSYGKAIKRLRIQDVQDLLVPLPPRTLGQTVADLDARAAELDKEATEQMRQTVRALYAQLDARIGQVTLPGWSFSLPRSQTAGRWDVPFGRTALLRRHLVTTGLFRRLAEVARIVPSTLRGFYPEQRVNYIQLGDVDPDFFTIRSHEEASVADLPSRVRQPLAADQVLLANSGRSLGTTAQPVAVAPAELDGALSTNALTVLTFPDAPFYWALCLKHPWVLVQIAGLVSGSMQPYLNKRDLDGLLVPVLANVWREDFHQRAEVACQLRLRALALRRQATQQVDHFLDETLGDLSSGDG